MSARLKELYNDQIIEAMTKKFGYKNVMEVPKLTKVTINMGLGEAKENAKILSTAFYQSSNKSCPNAWIKRELLNYI